jgi:hypothetical protein
MTIQYWRSSHSFLRFDWSFDAIILPHGHVKVCSRLPLRMSLTLRDNTCVMCSRKREARLRWHTSKTPLSQNDVAKARPSSHIKWRKPIVFIFTPQKSSGDEWSLPIIWPLPFPHNKAFGFEGSAGVRCQATIHNPQSTESLGRTGISCTGTRTRLRFKDQCKWLLPRTEIEIGPTVISINCQKVSSCAHANELIQSTEPGTQLIVRLAATSKSHITLTVTPIYRNVNHRSVLGLHFSYVHNVIITMVLSWVLCM